MDQADGLREFFTAQRQRDRRAAGLKELVESLNWVLDDPGLLNFDDDNPVHWARALRVKLREELEVHVPADDMRYVDAMLLLAEQADWLSHDEWLSYMSDLREAHGVVGPPKRVEPEPEPADEVTVIDEVVVPGPVQRCDPSMPVEGAIDLGDPEDAPPHGDRRRYTSPKYSCRCDYCRTANTTYRAELRDRKTPTAQVINLKETAS